MSWVVAGVAAASMVANIANQNEQRQQQKNAMIANAAQQQYSPWTGMKSGMVGYSGGTQTGAAAAGALGGALQGIQIKKSLDTTPKSPTLANTPTQGPGMAGSGNPYSPGSPEFNQWNQMQAGQVTS